MIAAQMLLCACVMVLFQLLPITHGYRCGIAMATYNVFLNPVAHFLLVAQMYGKVAMKM